MKTLRILFGLLLSVALTACKNDGEADVFYTVSYPVSTIEAIVEIADPTPPPTEPEEPENPEEPEPEDPDNPGNPEEPAEPGSGKSEEPEEPEEPENPLLQVIRDDVIAKAPVQEGGRYVLDFKYHNGGPLTVYPGADGSAVTGTFVKEPDKLTELKFYYAEQEYLYTTAMYLDESNTRKMMLTIDLTEEYKALYPDANITKVNRREYTTQNYN